MRKTILNYQRAVAYLESEETQPATMQDVEDSAVTKFLDRLMLQSPQGRTLLQTLQPFMRDPIVSYISGVQLGFEMAMALYEQAELEAVVGGKSV